MYRLLIVEEDAHCREALLHNDWTGLGFENTCYATGFDEGLDLALLRQPQVVLIGMTLGDRRGYELAAQLAAMEQPPLCCLMAAHADIHEVRRAMRAGCRDLLKRPPEPLALREFLEWAAVTELPSARPTADTGKELDPVLGREYASFGSVTNKILSAVRANYRVSLSLTAIARRSDMSSKYIGRVFLKETGMRFTDYLMAYRMLEAKRLILSTTEKISVISGMVGYSQQNNFYIHFRQYFGVSPSSLRNVTTMEEAIP